MRSKRRLRRALTLALIGALPLASGGGCAACRTVGRATVATAKATYNVTKVAVVGTAKATKRGMQAISRDPQAAPGDGEGTRIAYNPLDPDTTRPPDFKPSKPIETPTASDNDNGRIAMEDTPDAPMRGSQGVKHNLPSLDIETMIAEVESTSKSTRRR